MKVHILENIFVLIQITPKWVRFFSCNDNLETRVLGKQIICWNNQIDLEY